MKTIAYLRVPKDTQDLNNKRLEILNYAIKHHMAVDEVIEVDMSSRKDEVKPHVAEMMDLLKQGDMLVIRAD
jgi:DNA invertase Pin-like site-specific DNA recombinase